MFVRFALLTFNYKFTHVVCPKNEEGYKIT